MAGTSGAIPGTSGTCSGSHSTMQSLVQSNSVVASNSGTGGTVLADNNTQTIIGVNAAHVRVGSTSIGTQGLIGWLGGNNGNNGGTSHSTTQTLAQANALDASNSGTGGTVLADNNVQTHIGLNAGQIHIPNLQNLQNNLQHLLGK